MNLPEDKDPLWNLLAKSPPPYPSPRFAARVARAAREAWRRDPARSFWAWLPFGRPASPRLAWGLSGGLAVAAALALGFFLRQETPDALPAAGFAEYGPATDAEAAFDPATEIEAVEHLAQLMTVVDPATLSDELFADLLF